VTRKKFLTRSFEKASPAIIRPIIFLLLKTGDTARIANPDKPLAQGIQLPPSNPFCTISCDNLTSPSKSGLCPQTITLPEVSSG